MTILPYEMEKEPFDWTLYDAIRGYLLSLTVLKISLLVWLQSMGKSNRRSQMNRVTCCSFKKKMLSTVKESVIKAYNAAYHHDLMADNRREWTIFPLHSSKLNE